MIRFYFFLLIASYKSIAAQFEDISTVKFVFYYGPQVNNKEVYNVEDGWKISAHPSFNNSKKTTCYIHGYTENQISESLLTVIDAYLNRIQEYNLITLDWGKMAKGRYIVDAVKNAFILGDLLAGHFNKFFDKGINLEKFHLVGHSLGAQLAGFIGRTMQDISVGKIKLSRITALDPAFPGFYIIPLRKAVNANDAHFVDVIHTDGWIYGGPLSTGTVDFWPNRGGLTQPGCPKRDFKILTATDLCSHRQSWRYWAESVLNQYKIDFWSVKASSWQDFRIRSQFMKLPLAKMGLECPKNISGNYFLQTNPKPPFARGLNGVTFDSKILGNFLQKTARNNISFKY